MRKGVQRVSAQRTPFFRGDRSATPVIVGHRGAPSVARENTPESFAAAWAAGAEWVELDIRRGADDTLAVHHDPVMPDGAAIVDLDRAGLSARGVWTLDDVLSTLPPGLGVDLEVKNLPGEPDYDETQRAVDRLATAIQQVVGRRPLMSSSFNPLTVQRLSGVLRAVPVGLLHGPALRVDAAAELARDLGASVLCPHADALPPLDAETVGVVHGAGLDLMVWVVDDRERALRLAAAGVDALCTNEPARLVAALRGSA